jgi:hypothetical protein
VRRAKLFIALPKELSRASMELLWSFLPQSTTALHIVEIVTWEAPSDIIDKLNSLSTADLRETMVICTLDPCGPAPWDLARLGCDGRGYGAILVLLFPEVYFVFLGGPSPLTALVLKRPLTTGRTESESDYEAIKRHHMLEWPELLRLAELLHFHAIGFRTLFDPCGLRNLFKACLLDIATDNYRGPMFLPDIQRRLGRRAACADDEDDYVSLHAYTAYKLGYCVSVLRSEEEFGRALRVPTPLDLIISDWDLAYPDHEQRTSAESHDEISRSRLLEQSVPDGVPVLVVSAYSADQSLRRFCDRRPEQRTLLAKPHTGVHALASRIKVITVCSGAAGSLTGAARPGKGAGAPEGESVQQSTARNHSLPYARSLVTKHLLQRAREIQVNSTSPVDDGVLQAVLALEAKELLGELSRTAAYDACRLQLEGELLAELSWFGVDFHGEVASRIEELENDTDRLLKREQEMGLDRSTLERSRDNFLYGLVDNLRRRYSDSGQIVASEHCLRKVNELEDRIRMASVAEEKGVKGWALRLENLITGRFWFYVRWATNHGTSVGAVIRANCLVVGLSAFVYCVLLSIHPLTKVVFWHQLGIAAGHSLFTFAELQPGVQEYDQAMVGRSLGGSAVFLYRLATLIEIGFAYLNLGLLISVLYRRLMRTGS